MTQLTAQNVGRLTAWTARVASNVRVTSQSDIRPIAMMCLDAEAAADGAPYNVWHMAAQFYGMRCNCVPCARSR